MDAPAATPAYPVGLSLDAPNRIARWRPFVHFILAVPHLIVLWALSVLSGAITFVAFFAILFTKRYPEGLFKVAAMTWRYNWRVLSYVLYLREDYPPFEFETVLDDPGTDPARYSIEYQEEFRRFLPLVKWLLLFPHYLAMIPLMVGAVLVWFGSFFAVLFAGRYPEGMRNYMVGVNRWMHRVYAYGNLMTDDYPPFSLQP
jgi:hypothetical protein